jgi:hypothetical protein
MLNKLSKLFQPKAPQTVEELISSGGAIAHFNFPDKDIHGNPVLHREPVTIELGAAIERVQQEFSRLYEIIGEGRKARDETTLRKLIEQQVRTNMATNAEWERIALKVQSAALEMKDAEAAQDKSNVGHAAVRTLQAELAARQAAGNAAGEVDALRAQLGGSK